MIFIVFLDFVYKLNYFIINIIIWRIWEHTSAECTVYLYIKRATVTVILTCLSDNNIEVY